MRALAPFLIVLCCAAAPVLAEMSSIRPMPRPTLAAPVTAELVVESSALRISSIRPLPRPASLSSLSTPMPPPKKRGGLAALFRPGKEQPKRSDPQAPKTYASGAVCKDSAIQGTAIPEVNGAQDGCGIENPVRITEVDGVALSMPATLDCDTARALRKWVTTKVKPAFGRNEVVSLQVAAHYACRGRNNKKGARISEHGRGKAIDIAGFKLASGVEVTVLQDFKTNRGKAIRAAHKGACGIFGTTLGPGSDGYHADHLHLDTAKHRSGTYCK